MKTKIIAALLIVVGLINFFPVFAVVSGERLSALYGISVTDSNVMILLRHRAMLFGVVGGFIIYSAFRRHLQPLAFVGGLLSMLSFIVLTWQAGQVNAQLNKVVIADMIAIILMIIAVLLYRYTTISTEND